MIEGGSLLSQYLNEKETKNTFFSWAEPVLVVKLVSPFPISSSSTALVKRAGLNACMGVNGTNLTKLFLALHTVRAVRKYSEERC